MSDLPSVATTANLMDGADVLDGLGEAWEAENKRRDGVPKVCVCMCVCVCLNLQRNDHVCICIYVGVCVHTYAKESTCLNACVCVFEHSF
jgi:diacylglycerol kinase